MIFYYRHNYGCTGTCVWLFIYDNFIGFWPVPFDVLPFLIVWKIFGIFCGTFGYKFQVLRLRYKKEFLAGWSGREFFLHTTQLFFHHQKINNIFHNHGDSFKQIKKL
jgi:hypothetical protein